MRLYRLGIVALERVLIYIKLEDAVEEEVWRDAVEEEVCWDAVVALDGGRVFLLKKNLKLIELAYNCI